MGTWAKPAKLDRQWLSHLQFEHISSIRIQNCRRWGESR